MIGLTLRPRARLDLIEIWSYIADGSETNADLFIDKLYHSMTMLRQQPRAGRQREDLGDGVRAFPVGHYIVFYQAQLTAIEIVRVLHAARNIDEIFEP